MSDRGDHSRPDPLEEAVIVVDDQEQLRRGLAANLRLHGFECRTAPDAETAVSMLASREAAIVITDIRMPGHDGMWLLEQIQSSHRNTAVIVLTGFADVELATRALRMGASDFLVKPVGVLDVLTAVNRAMERRRLILANRAHQEELEKRVRAATSELRETLDAITRSYQATLEALCSALDAREQETAEHSVRVTRFALEIADELGVTGKKRQHLEWGALLHDIGKIGIPDAILRKPGPLEADEWAVMRRHPLIGNEILSGIAFLHPASEIVLSHHERWDGTGYPRGLRGDDIPLGARIFSVADAMDAITSDRLYRPARSFQEAFREIGRCTGTQFDPRVVRALLGISSRWVEGTGRRISRTSSSGHGATP